MRRVCLFTLIFCLIAIVTYAQIPSAELQIHGAVQAAPPETRDGATVLGYDPNGKLVTLRKGTNQMICLADDPNREDFSVACYHKDLEPFMARGRELKAEGKKGKERFTIRQTEVKAGTLKMPDHPTTLHVLNSKTGQFDLKTGDIKDAYIRYVVYMPFATGETTGLPTKPSGPGVPWLMDSGTYRAHIMITPPRPKPGQ